MTDGGAARYIRGHIVTILAVVVVVCSVTYAGYIERTRDAERIERLEQISAERADRNRQINALACAFDAYYAKVRIVTATRGLPGDAILNDAIDDVRRAAIRVGGRCPSQ